MIMMKPWRRWSDISLVCIFVSVGMRIWLGITLPTCILRTGTKEHFLLGHCHAGSESPEDSAITDWSDAGLSAMDQLADHAIA